MALLRLHASCDFVLMLHAFNVVLGAANAARFDVLEGCFGVRALAALATEVCEVHDAVLTGFDKTPPVQCQILCRSGGHRSCFLV